MTAHVHIQAAAGGEAFLAHCADVPLITGVRFHVPVQIRGLAELFTTNRALVTLVVHVDEPVLVPRTSQGEGGVAQRAPVGACSCAVATAQVHRQVLVMFVSEIE